MKKLVLRETPALRAQTLRVVPTSIAERTPARQRRRAWSPCTPQKVRTHRRLRPMGPEVLLPQPGTTKVASRSCC